MFVYLLVLAIMAAGATVLAFSVMQFVMVERQINIYDARGFYLVILVFVTFSLTSLAYFWGESRFTPVAEEISQSLIGVLFALCSCLAGLAYGLIRLKEVDS